MHVSLDSALGRQRRLNSVGESVLQIAPNAAAAYSLRSLTGGDPQVVRVRRVIDNAESDFTAAGISSGALVNFVNQIQTLGTAVNGTGSFDNYTVSNLSNTGFSADNSAGGTGSAGFPYVFKDDDVLVVKYTVTNFSSTSSLSPALRGVNNVNSVTGKTNSGTVFTANGTYTDTLTATADGTHLMFADGNTGSYTISDFEIVSHSSSGFVETWYDQSGNSKDAVQETAGSQPKIVNSGSLVTLNSVPALSFDGSSDLFNVTGFAFSPSGDFLAVTVSKISTGNLIDTRDGGSDGFFLQQGSADFRHRYNGDGSINVSGNDQHIVATSELNGTTLTAYKNSSSSGTDTVTAGLSTTQAITIGRTSFTNGNFTAGSVQEIILYDTDKSANRAALETNINSHYSIF